MVRCQCEYQSSGQNKEIKCTTDTGTLELEFVLHICHRCAIHRICDAAHPVRISTVGSMPWRLMYNRSLSGGQDDIASLAAKLQVDARSPFSQLSGIFPLLSVSTDALSDTAEFSVPRSMKVCPIASIAILFYSPSFRMDAKVRRTRTCIQGLQGAV
jgi:hypothetical protein